MYNIGVRINPEPKKPQVEHEGHHHMIAGATAGIAGVVAGHPLDTIKTRLQAPQTPFTNVYQCFKYTLQAEGFKGFYRGIGPPLSTVAISNSLTFTVYGKAKNLLAPYCNEWSKVALAGAASGVAAAFVVTPRDLIKSRLQIFPCGNEFLVPAPRKRFPSVDCCQQIWKNEGLRGLYRGGWASVVRDVPGNAVYFVVYEGLKKAFTPPDEALPPIHWLVLSGGCSGVSYWTTIYPIDTVRTCLQIQEAKTGRYKGILHCAKLIFKEQGIRGFYRGYLLCISRSFPISAVNFCIYEGTLKLLHSYSQP